MNRVLNRFYTAKDVTTLSWCVLEHTNKPWCNMIKTNLTYDEAEEYAGKLNKDYEDEKVIRR